MLNCKDLNELYSSAFIHINYARVAYHSYTMHTVKAKQSSISNEFASDTCACDTSAILVCAHTKMH